MVHLYSFEAKEIQRYIFNGGKLKDMVGGSKLVAGLCDGFLKACLKQLDIPDSSIIANAAGWARLEIDDGTKAEALYRIFPLLVDRYAPGLQVLQSLVAINGDFNAALVESRSQLRAQRNLSTSSLPESTPLMEKSTRTGLPATNEEHEEFIDRGTLRKRQAKDKEKGELEDAVTPEKSKKKCEGKWPLDHDDIVSSSNSYVALIHADGNDLGKLVMRLNLQKDEYRTFSKAVDEATTISVRRALEASVFRSWQDENKTPNNTKLPARLLVLGGDDVTLVIRADLAFSFVETFLKAFEEESEAAFKKAGLERAGKLTACAGVAIVKSHYPFMRANDLAESLCSFAKEKAKSLGQTHTPSCFAFHRVSGSIAGDYREIRERELTAKDNVRLWNGPYAIGNTSKDLVPIEDLKQLAETLRKFSSSPLEKALSRFHEGKKQGLETINRYLQVVKREEPERAQKLIEGFSKITGSSSDNGECILSPDNHSPLQEALMVMEFTEKRGKEVANA